MALEMVLIAWLVEHFVRVLLITTNIMLMVNKVKAISDNTKVRTLSFRDQSQADVKTYLQRCFNEIVMRKMTIVPNFNNLMSCSFYDFLSLIRQLRV